MDCRVAVLFFLLGLSSSASAEVRDAAWEDVNRGTYKFLALVNATKNCSAAIVSKAAVLTCCEDVPEGTNVYAGLVAISEATENPQDDIQMRQVVKVQYKEGKADLKICFMNQNWEFGTYVAAVPLRVEQGSTTTADGCSVVAFREKDGQAQVIKLDVGDYKKCKLDKDVGVDRLYSAAGTDDVEGLELTGIERGGPVVCGKSKAEGELWALIDLYEKGGETGEGPNKKTIACYVYDDIAPHSPWFNEKITEFEETGGTGVTGEPGGTQAPSNAKSIHRPLNKSSVYQVLVLVAVAMQFLPRANY